MKLIDTNVILRYLMGDVPKQLGMLFRATSWEMYPSN